LEEGKIVEQGNPVKLLEKGGAYAAIWKMQQEKDSNLKAS
jgi:ABC-type multidrug transport system fused ATPase/permease subunit